MITEIETAIAAYLTEKLGEDETLTADTWVAKPATAISAKPKNKALLSVAAASVPQTFPQLQEAMVHIHVMCPAEPPAIAAMHTLLEQAVSRAFSTIDSPTVEADVAAALHERLPAWNGGGIYVTGWQPGREEMGFNPHFEVKVGMVRV